MKADLEANLVPRRTPKLGNSARTMSLSETSTISSGRRMSQRKLARASSLAESSPRLRYRWRKHSAETDSVDEVLYEEDFGVKDNKEESVIHEDDSNLFVKKEENLPQKRSRLEKAKSYEDPSFMLREREKNEMHVFK